MVLADVSRDVRYTLKTLRRDAMFTTFAIVIAGLGIGASVTVFSVVHALILRPLPLSEPDRLVWIANHDSSGLSGQTTQVNHLLDLREKSRTLAGVAGYFAFYGVGDSLMSGGGEPERLSAVPVSENFFDVLGVTPHLGRFFSADEARWKGPHAVVLSYDFWQRRFKGNASIVGQAVTIDDEPNTVVGVLPASFDFGSLFAPGNRFDLYKPFPLSEETNRWGNTMAIIGRLKPGVTAAQAQAEMRTIAPLMTSEHPDRNSFEGFVKPLADQLTGRIRLAVWVLAAAVGLVMLIVCANLSNLLLARTASRQKEIAIRAALGAGRARLLAQMLTEGLVLSSAGAILGVVLAFLGTRSLARLDAISIPLLRDVRTDTTVLAFTVLVAVATGVLFALAPAFQAGRIALTGALKEAVRGSTEGRSGRRIRSGLVVTEIAFACILIVGAGVLVRSLIRVMDVDLGFSPDHTLTMRVDPDHRYTTPEQRDAYYDELLRTVRSIPGVEAAAITDALPLGRNRSWGPRAKGVVYERGKAPGAFVRVVSDGYAATMRIPVRAGRDFTSSDVTSTEPVIVVNETMAKRLWPGVEAVGQHVTNACGDRRVVGVVGDVRHLALEQSSGNEMYIPLRQCRDLSSADLVLRSSLPPAQAASSVRTALATLAPNLPGNQFRSLQQIVDASTSPRRFTVLLLGGFAVFALVLASLGIYALISYSVSQKSQEIGIRMALGASAAEVQRPILVQTLRLAAMGMTIGAIASFAMVNAAKGLLYEVDPADPASFAGMVVILTLVALVAGYVPARRASRVDPIVALRVD